MRMTSEPGMHARPQRLGGSRLPSSVKVRLPLQVLAPGGAGVCRTHCCST